MRVTDSMTFNAVLQGQNRAARRLLDASRAASSGERVAAPSDDPVAWSAAVGHEARISRLEGRAATTTRAAGDLDAAEAALASAGDLVQQARELALTAANGSVDPQTRANLGRQVTDLRNALLGLANTRGASGYLFGGTRTDQPPFSALGAFGGNDTAAAVEVADGVTARANASGARAFTAAGGRDLLADLDALATGLSANNLTVIQGSIAALDAGHQQLVNARVDTGLGAERLRSAAEVSDNAMTLARAARAGEVEADLPSTLAELTNARAAYERGVAVSRELLQISSVNRF
jgi:flagellar hook-associated protein 3 FlgL